MVALSLQFVAKDLCPEGTYRIQHSGFPDQYLCIPDRVQVPDYLRASDRQS